MRFIVVFLGPALDCRRALRGYRAAGGRRQERLPFFF
jgi:hypothetical protein